MNCNNCGKKVPNDASFCPYCGGKIEKEVICTGCGTKLPADFRFCMKCGKAVIESEEKETKVEAIPLWEVPGVEEIPLWNVSDVEEIPLWNISDVEPVSLGSTFDMSDKRIKKQLSPYACHTEYYGCGPRTGIRENNGYILWEQDEKCFLRNTETSETKFVMEVPKCEENPHTRGELFGFNNYGIFYLFLSYGVCSQIHCYDFDGNLIHKCSFNPDGYEILEGELYIYNDCVVVTSHDGDYLEYVDLYYFSLSQNNGMNPVYIMRRNDGNAVLHSLSMDKNNIYYHAEFTWETEEERGREKGWYCYNMKTGKKCNLNGANPDPVRCLEEPWLFEDYATKDKGIGIVAVYPEKGIMVTGRKKAECERYNLPYIESHSNSQWNGSMFKSLVIRKIGKATGQPVLVEYAVPDLTELEEFNFYSPNRIGYYDGEDLYALKGIGKTVHIGRNGISEIDICPYSMYCCDVVVCGKYVYVNCGSYYGYMLLPRDYDSWKDESKGNPQAIDIKQWSREASY